jgi:hypothetical protein
MHTLIVELSPGWFFNVTAAVPYLNVPKAEWILDARIIDITMSAPTAMPNDLLKSVELSDGPCGTYQSAAKLNWDASRLLN